MSSNYKLREEIELVSLPDGTGIISDPSNKKCHNLNPTGVLICRHLINGAESREIVQHLQSQYITDIETHTIEKDLFDFLSELKNHNLLVANDADSTN